MCACVCYGSTRSPALPGPFLCLFSPLPLPLVNVVHRCCIAGIVWVSYITAGGLSHMYVSRNLVEFQDEGLLGYGFFFFFELGSSFFFFLCSFF